MSDRQKEHVDVRHDPRVLAEADEKAVKAASARRTRRSFVAGGVAAAAGYGVLHWINNSKSSGELQSILRRGLDTDASIDRVLSGYEHGLAPTYAPSQARELRLNGVIGLDRQLDLSSWRLQMAGVANVRSSPLYVPDVTAWEYKYTHTTQSAQSSDNVKLAPKGNGPKSPPKAPGVSDNNPPPSGGSPQAVNSLNPTGVVDSDAGAAIAARFQALARRGQRKRNIGDAEAGASYSSLDIGSPGLLLTMSDLAKLPKVEFITQFKCIEGWSEITPWAGYRLRDLIDMYPPAKINGREPRFVYMETPDGNFYCGYNMSAARHPQSLLVTEMSGRPLAQEHGAPLRLHMPIKYGYKQLKRIGLIAYTDRKPDDFWTKLGYDWYAGL